jgi:hypothetical protein
MLSLTETLAAENLPSGQSRFVLSLGADPAAFRAFGKHLLLPEGRIALEIVHQEFGGGEGSRAM